jgi:hypothetical protein
MKTSAPDTQRIRKVLWLANLTAVMFIGGIILFLPRMMATGEPGEAGPAILVLALLSLPVAFLARRISGMDAAREPAAGGRPDALEQSRKATARFAVAGTLAELPAMFGLVYAVLGGDGFYALCFAAAALIATLLLRPE